jgi:hypothetical protein
VQPDFLLSSRSCTMRFDRGSILRQNITHWLRTPLLPLFLGIVAVIESIWILRSDGFYPIDECAHFLYSRFVLDVLPVTVQTWHRPGRLWLFALPAQLGHSWTMFFCLGLYLFLLLVTYRIAVLMRIKHAAWVVVLTGLQPVLFDISYTCLAEAPAALLIALSYLYHLKGKHGWCLAIASAVFLFRFEMFGYALLMSFIYIRNREWRIIPLVLLGPIAWIGSSAIISGDVMTFFREWSHFSDLGKYVAGSTLTHYIGNLHTIFGFVPMLFLAAGVIFIARARESAGFGTIYFIIALGIIVNTLAGAEVLHWTGSIGDFRYVAVVGPFIGIVSAKGLSEVLERIRFRWAQRVLSVVVLVALVMNCVLTTHPHRWSDEERMVISLTRTLRSEYPDLTLLSNNYVSAYAMDVPPWGGPRYARLESDMLARHPECVILWDPFSSNPRFYRTELTRDRLLGDTTLVVVKKYAFRGEEYLVLYRNIRW